MDRTDIPLPASTHYEPRICTECGGSGGSATVEISGGVRRGSWKSCPACSGTGKR